MPFATSPAKNRARFPRSNTLLQMIRALRKLRKRSRLQLRFASGMLASCLSSYGFGCNRFRVYGTRGQLESEPLQGYSGNRLFQVRGRERQEVQYEPVNHFAAEMDHLCQCIKNDQKPLAPGEEGLKDMKVIEAAYESARTGKPIKIG